MTSDSESQDISTLLAAAFGGAHGSVTPPIVQSSLFTFDSYQAFEDRMAGRTDTAIYTRVQNPTVAAFEALMATAERGEAAVGFASGMAAISSTIIAFVKPGDRIACVEHAYPDSYRLFERLLRPFGVDVSYHTIAAFVWEEPCSAGRDLPSCFIPSFLLSTVGGMRLFFWFSKKLLFDFQQSPS